MNKGRCKEDRRRKQGRDTSQKQMYNFGYESNLYHGCADVCMYEVGCTSVNSLGTAW